MSDQVVHLHGWLVPFPVFLREEPRDADDLVREVTVHVFGFVPSDIYETEPEAWAAARRYLAEAKEQAEKDLLFLSQPSGTAVPPEKVAEWVAQAREELRIANKGLSLCPPA